VPETVATPAPPALERPDGSVPTGREPRRRLPVGRILLVWVLTAATLLLLSQILAGVELNDFGSALLAAALLGLANAFVWPLIVRFALPVTVLTLGLGVIVLNGAMVLLVAKIEPGLHVSGLGPGIAVALGVTIVNTAVTSLLAIDDDDFWYRNVVRRHARRTARPATTDVPGLFFVEIDGLAHDVLLRAIRDGNAPTMARWMREEGYRLTRWETDWSSQTGACQAGLLHGNNDDMPAFRWWEKERGKPIVTNHPRDAMEIERRHSDGRGLLFSNGASRANIVSGDAPHSLLTMSTVMLRDRNGGIGKDYFAYFSNPYNVMRTLALVVREVVSELWSAAQQRRRDVQPRIERGFVYSLMRAWATIIQRDLQVEAIIADMYAGLPVAYTTFLAYDEVAHHSGIERSDTLATLRQVDRQIGRIAAARSYAPRPYRLVVLSDHGQSQGATFLDRYGISLEDLVRKASEGAATAAVTEPPSEAAGYLGASFTEASLGGSRVAGAVERRAQRRAAAETDDEGDDEVPEVVVMASGCLGHATFPREPGRVTLEQLTARHPRLLPALCEHPGIGFALVHSEEHGAVALSGRGINYLDEGRVEGEDPLAPFGPNAGRHLRRTDGFAHCPDIVVNSTYWTDTDEVAAFEELVGSHGGMGGTQSFPFVLHPPDLELPDQELVGAEAVHRHLRRWLVELGHGEYAIGAALEPAVRS
jgi:uncharacterized membrane protein YvlD (DUF360 family)